MLVKKRLQSSPSSRVKMRFRKGLRVRMEKCSREYHDHWDDGPSADQKKENSPNIPMGIFVKESGCKINVILKMCKLVEPAWRENI